MSREGGEPGEEDVDEVSLGENRDDPLEELVDGVVLELLQAHACLSNELDQEHVLLFL